MATIETDLKCDALRALQARLDARREKGIRHGVPAEEWSDEAQTVGWCRDLLLRWPEDALRRQMVSRLACFGIAA